MNFRIFIVAIFFLVLPLVGLIIVLLSNDILLTPWDYIDLSLSVSFTIALIFRRYKWSKILSGLLFGSILLKEGIESFEVMESSFLSVISAILSVIFMFVLGFLIYYLLLMPIYEQDPKRVTNKTSGA